MYMPPNGATFLNTRRVQPYLSCYMCIMYLRVHLKFRLGVEGHIWRVKITPSIPSIEVILYIVLIAAG